MAYQATLERSRRIRKLSEDLVDENRIREIQRTVETKKHVQTRKRVTLLDEITEEVVSRLGTMDMPLPHPLLLSDPSYLFQKRMRTQEDTLKLHMQKLYHELKLFADNLSSRPCYQDNEDKTDRQMSRNLTAGCDEGVFGMDTLSLASGRKTRTTDSICEEDEDEDDDVFQRCDPSAHPQAERDVKRLRDVSDASSLSRSDGTCVCHDCSDQGKTSLSTYYKI
jgi:hypothetical protein